MQQSRLCTVCERQKSKETLVFINHCSLYTAEELYFGKTTIAYFVSQKRLIFQGWSNMPVWFTLRKNTEQLYRNLWVYPQAAGISLRDSRSSRCQLLPQTRLPTQSKNSPDHSFTFLIPKIIFSLVIFCSFHICKSQYTHERSNLHLLHLPGVIRIYRGKIHTMEF